MSSIVLKETASANIPTPNVGKATLFLNTNGDLTVKSSDGNVENFPAINASSNTSVFFNDQATLGTSANFTWDKTTNILTVLGNVAATRVLTDNLLHANGAVWDLELPAGANWEIQFNNNNSFGATGNLQMLGGTQLLVGATASNVDFPSARVIASQDNTGNSSTDNIGIAAEAVANSANSSVTGIGVLGHARANGSTKGTGIQGQAFVTASGDTGAAVGVRAYAIDTHSGGYNIGFLGNAMNSSVGNYAFYVQNGGIASIENNTFWDLNDNSNAALTFNSTGKANIFGIETTDNSEGIFTSGYLNVTGNISALGIKTNNYYYSNGSPVDFQQAAGSNTQIQYNNANDFGASANFTFNSATNVLTVTGNISTGNVSATGAVNAATLGGSLTTAAQGNITSVGTLTSLTVSGNITSGNIDGGNLVKGNYVQGTLTTAAQPNITSVGTLLSLSVTGNITSGNIDGGNLVKGNYVQGTLTTAAQPNITSVGTLSSLTVTGNVAAGNLNATSAVVASTLTSNVTTGTAPLTVTSTTRVANLNVNYANVSDFGVVTAQSTGTYYPTFVNGSSTGNYALSSNSGISANLANGGLAATTFIGNVSGNITGVLANGTSNVSIPAVNGNVNVVSAGNTTFVVTGTGANVAGTLNATGNLTTGAELSVSGNAIITGNLTINGNLVYVNVDTLAVEDPIIQLQAGPNGAAPSANSGKDVGTGLNYYDTQARIAWMGWDVSNVEFGMGSVVTIASEVVTFTTYGNLRLGNIIGNGQALTGLTGANVTGQVGNAAIAGTVYTNAQPNITSVGSLTSLTLAANGNITMSGTGSQLSGANLVSATNLTGTLTTAAQPNITSVGTLTSVAVTGNVTAGNVYANSGTVGASLLAGTLTTAAQPNVTSVGTLTSVAVTGNVTAGNVYANSGTVGASLLAGTLTTAAQPNVTSLGTLTSLGVNGNITGVNVTANTGFFISSVGTGISAAGTVQGNATALTKDFNVVSTVNSGTGVVLPTAVAGMRITVMNTGGNTLNVYPATNGIINSAAANIAYSLNAGGRLDFCAVSTTQWYTLSATFA